jgi:hypothetical protein
MKSIFLLAVAVAATLSSSSVVRAAPIAWVGSGRVSSNADVDTVGTLAGALQVGSATQRVVNGVTFVRDDVAAASIAAGSITYAFNFNNAFGPFYSGDTGDTEYNAALTSGRYTDPGAGTVTMGALIVGQQYRVQIWNVDTRSAPLNNRDRTYTNGTSVVLNTGGDAGKPQWAIGTFVADATTETITMSGNGSYGAQLNLIQTRAVPEPASAGLLALAGLSLLARRRRNA